MAGWLIGPGRSARTLRARHTIGADGIASVVARQVGSEVLRQGRHASRLHGWAGHPGYVRRAHGPGWALVGDASYLKDPITTPGVTDALRDAQLLADAVGAASSRQLLEQIAMASYQAARDHLSHQLFDATEAVAAYDWDTPTIQRLLREVSASMSDELDHLNGLLRTGAVAAAERS